MSNVNVAIIQMSFSDNIESNLNQLEKNIIELAKQGAQVILMPELPSYHYFCKQQNADYFDMAKPINESKIVQMGINLTKKYNIVLPVSFFERLGNTCYNSVAMIDADGEVLGIYRKSHIPDGIGYQEKYYFCPGQSGFKVWKTKYGNIGCAICWDQWFPECARVMALQNADMLLYPTAIGSEPHLPDYDSKDHWQRTMQGHAAANMIPVLAANRVGIEETDGVETTFYGSSFITDNTGKKIAQASRDKSENIISSLDLYSYKIQRTNWGLYRDRRPDLYNEIIKKN